jgi:predicted nucleotide-binding protein (sugar kinase/HSP70/actin superfamily)
MQAWEKSIALFKKIATKRKKRPQVLMIGDLYVKNNEAFNQNIIQRVEEMGGEVVSSSVMEYVHYGMEIKRYGAEQHFKQMATYYVFKKILTNLEQTYLDPIKPLLSPIQECSWDEMFASLLSMGIDIGLHGETAITVSRAACLARSKQIDAVIHINPSFCCSGNVSISLLEKIREDFNLPILNIFYDGTDQPNAQLVPFMHYLVNNQV